jgi:hypothetical protein
MEIILPANARQLWIQKQKLDTQTPFGSGTKAVQAAVEHLGYVQIDTINVIERSHHHILFNRIPKYKRADLQKSQSQTKSIFEYWTHALSYVPTKDFRFFIPQMKETTTSRSSWFDSVTPKDLQKVFRLIKKNGAISIRDIADDVLVEKDHPWASRKPSKRALQFAFYSGRLVVSERQGMLKKYELTERHFGWNEKPKAATEKEILNYLLDRALRSQGLVSLDSICHLNAGRKTAIKALIESRVRKGELIPILIKGREKIQHWVLPEDRAVTPLDEEVAHLLSPFDPLVIQRKRLKLFFDYDHRFEAYLPKEKRTFGYFALPVLLDDQIVAAIDLKTDRVNKKLLLQQWTWLGKNKSQAKKRRIEEALHRFEIFQCATSAHQSLD